MATLRGVTVTGGYVSGTDDGGGIVNLGDLQLYGVHVTDNEAGDHGGGIYTQGNFSFGRQHGRLQRWWEWPRAFVPLLASNESAYDSP